MLGEATAMKVVALLLAGLDAHVKSLLEQEWKLELDKMATNGKCLLLAR